MVGITALQQGRRIVEGRIPFDLLPQVTGNIAVITCGDYMVNPRVTDALVNATGARWAYTVTLKGGTRAFTKPNSSGTPGAEIAKATFADVVDVERARMDLAAEENRDPADEKFALEVDVQHLFCAGHGLHIHPQPLADQYDIVHNSQAEALPLFEEDYALRDRQVVQLIYNNRTGLWVLGLED
jgi:hypothetical protein